MNGIHIVTVNSDDHTDRNFGNVAFELVPVGSGRTWGYWKTHTGTDATPPEAPQDLVYLLALEIDLGLTGGTHLDVQTPYHADTVFAVDGSGPGDEPPWLSLLEISDLCSVFGDCRNDDFSHPADCEGDCHEQALVQFLAVELNVASGEFTGDELYVNAGCGGAYNAAR